MSFLMRWARNILGFFGIWNKSAKVLFLGLDNAGKTTLLHRLKKETLSSFQPTYHPNQDELWFGNLKFKTFDMGGHDTARKLWKQYCQNVDAIVFLVDSAARERFPESKKELDVLLAADELQNVPFLILGNKIDMPRASSEDELRNALGLHATSGKGKVEGREIRPIEVFMCTVLNKEGYGEGFQWLAQFLK
eukprot:gnl/Hemi2/15050_TR5086_c0_g1_i1.p1 gnl/Hemi2/15050_TR5086_c0_g1~~gnl/Hemi2/15050_TR5086_c0_g1_i1.p1  ORF type:complete len:192 (+),score=81.99 gnl/Hemi2/15050_TR5086_c0_g1_i1:116-691(+)